MPAMQVETTEERAGGAALVAGALAIIVTMALHPTGHDFHAAADPRGVGHLNAAVHGLAIASTGLWVVGALALTRRLATPGGLERAGFVAHAVGAGAGVLAAVLNGFVATGLLGDLARTSGAEGDGLRLLLDYNGRLNQALAAVLLVATWTAVVLWSLVIVRRGALPRALGQVGLVVGVLALLVTLSGHVKLDVHGFGALIVTQALWLGAAGVLLRRGAGASTVSA